MLSLPFNLYHNLVYVANSSLLDFDDAYQYNIAKYYGLKIVTMDKDFTKTKGVDLIFL